MRPTRITYAAAAYAHDTAEDPSLADDDIETEDDRDPEPDED